MKKSLLWLVVLVLSISMVATFSLAGCKKEEAAVAEEEEAVVEEEVTIEEEVEEPVAEELTLTVWTYDYSPYADFLNSAFEEYENLHPNVTIDYVYLPFGDYADALVTQLAAGAGPDVFVGWDVWFADFLDKGLLDIADYNALGYGSLEEMADDFPGDSWKMCATEDNAYGVVEHLNSLLFFINNEQFREVGLDPETDFPKTWDDVIEVGKKLVIRDDDGGFVREGLDFIQDVPENVAIVSQIFYAQAGAEWFNEDMTECLLNSPEAIKAMSVVNSIINENEIGSPHYGNIDPTAHHFDWQQGHQSMVLGNPTVELLAEQYLGAGNYTIGQMPQMRDGVREATSGWGWFWAVNPATNKNTESWKLVDFITSYDPVRFYDDIKAFMVRNYHEWTNDPAADAIKTEFWDEWWESFETVVYPPQTTINTEAFNANYKAFQLIVNEGVDVEEALNQAKEEIDAALRRAGYAE